MYFFAIFSLSYVQNFALLRFRVQISVSLWIKQHIIEIQGPWPSQSKCTSRSRKKILVKLATATWWRSVDSSQMSKVLTSNTLKLKRTWCSSNPWPPDLECIVGKLDEDVSSWIFCKSRHLIVDQKPGRHLLSLVEKTTYLIKNPLLITSISFFSLPFNLFRELSYV